MLFIALLEYRQIATLTEHRGSLRMKVTIVLFLLILVHISPAFGQWIDTCAHLRSWRNIDPQNDPDVAKQQYDTLRLYIEKCAATDDDSWDVFNAIDGAVSLYATKDTLRFIQYRQWLISVFYLNTTNPAYFCACLGSIAGTYQYGKYPATLAGLAVLDYIRHDSNCYSPGLDKEFTKDSLSAYQHGLDPTHLPSLDSLDLGFLLHTSKVEKRQSLSSAYFASAGSSANPFVDQTQLDFTLNRSSYITLSIFDELGHQVYGNGKGSSYQAGRHLIQIDGRDLPKGVLYVRLSNGFGETRTVKLIHE